MVRRVLDTGIVLSIVIALLTGCGTLERVPGLAYPDGGQSAYVWHFAVHAGTFQPDWAWVMHIDGRQVDAGTQLEVPSGKHTVEILYQEDSYILIGTYMRDVSRRNLEFNAEPS